MNRTLLILCLVSGTLPGRAALIGPTHAVPHMLRLRAATFDPAAARAFSLSLRAPTAYQIVQLDGPVAADRRAALASQGAVVLDYIPDDAFVCRLDPVAGQAVARLPFVRAVTPYLPEFKLDPALSALTGRVSVNASLFDGVDPASVAAAMAARGLDARVIGRLVAVSGDAAAVRGLSDLEGIRWIEIMPRTRVMNDRTRVILGVNQVWQDFGVYGKGQVVCDFDTGLDLGNNKMSADFAGRVIDAMVTNPLNVDKDWSDRTGHGTLTAGIMAGAGIASGADPTTHRYIRSFAGVAPEASILIQEFDYDVCADQSPGFDYQTDLAPILDWAYQRGARIHNDSWGDDHTSFGAYSLHAQQIDQFVWDHPDFAMFVSAGNSGQDGMSEQDFLNKLGVNACTLQSLAGPANSGSLGDLSGLLGGGSGGDLGGLLGGSGSNLGDLLGGDSGFGTDPTAGTGTGTTGTGTGSTTGTGTGSTAGLLDLLAKYDQVMQEAQALAMGKVQPGSLTSPATAKNIVSVGASEGNRPEQTQNYQAAGFFADPIMSDPMANNVEGMAAFSSRGPALDGRTKPDIVAPGTFILSNRSPLGQQAVYWADYTDKNYAYSGGTSLSSPYAAGSAALVREWLQEKRGVADPSSALLKALLVNGAHDMAPGQYGTDPRFQEEGPRPNSVEGWGRIDLAATLDPKSPRATLFTDATPGLETGGSAEYKYQVSAGTPLAVTLVWNDYPANPSAAKALVNDLDLVVTGPDGVAHPGNGAPDHLNNVEGVDIAAPVAGTYTIKVSGFDVPHGPQPYAVVISGAATGSGSGSGGVAGDVDGDGKLTLADVVLALQAATGARTLTAAQKTAADVAPPGHPDGQITVADATLLLQAAVGVRML